VTPEGLDGRRVAEVLVARTNGADRRASGPCRGPWRPCNVRGVISALHVGPPRSIRVLRIPRPGTIQAVALLIPRLSRRVACGVQNPVTGADLGVASG
jgi:hypothetical protein